MASITIIIAINREIAGNARTVDAACKVEYRPICRPVELTADVLFSFFITR